MDFKVCVSCLAEPSVHQDGRGGTIGPGRDRRDVRQRGRSSGQRGAFRGQDELSNKSMSPGVVPGDDRQREEKARMTEQGRQDDSTQGSLDDRIRVLQEVIAKEEAKRESLGFSVPEWDEWNRLRRKHPCMWELCVHEAGHLVSNSVCGYSIVAVVVRPDRSGCVWADRPSGTAEEIRKNLVTHWAGQSAVEVLTDSESVGNGSDIASVREDARKLCGVVASDDDFNAEIVLSKLRSRRLVEKYRHRIARFALMLLQFHEQLLHTPLLASLGELDDPTKPKAVQATDANESKDDAGAVAGGDDTPAKGDAA